MKTFLRENMMIVVSIALPLLVVIFFALASVLPGLYSTPPAYDLLLTFQDRSNAKTPQVKISLVVKNERLRAIIVKSDNPGYGNNLRLFRYDHSTAEVVEISIQIPENVAEFDEGAEIPITGFEELRISEKLRAPDGYEFRGRRRGGGLMTEMFGGARNRTDVSIAKNGAIVRVRLPASDYWYNDVRFVGWVIE